MSSIRILILVALLGLDATAALARSRSLDAPVMPGQFDYYVLALSWSPVYCERHPEDRQQEGRVSQGDSQIFPAPAWRRLEAGLLQGLTDLVSDPAGVRSDHGSADGDQVGDCVQLAAGELHDGLLEMVAEDAWPIASP